MVEGSSGALIVADALAVGVEAATVTFAGDAWATGELEWGNYSKSFAWGAFGGFAAFKFARWGGATASGALWGSAVARNSVRVRPATTTSGAIWKDGSVDWATTRANMGINSGFNFGSCGAGSQSAGSVFGSC